MITAGDLVGKGAQVRPITIKTMNKDYKEICVCIHTYKCSYTYIHNMYLHKLYIFLAARPPAGGNPNIRRIITVFFVALVLFN